MSDPSAAVRAAFLTRLRAILNPTGVRVYDEVPSTRTWPYVALRTLQAIPDDGECAPDTEVFIDFDVWSKKLDHSETSSIVGQVRTALRTDLTVPDHAVISQALENVQFTGDPDPSVARAALSLRLDLQAV